MVLAFDCYKPKSPNDDNDNDLNLIAVAKMIEFILLQKCVCNEVTAMGISKNKQILHALNCNHEVYIDNTELGQLTTLTQ